jgi:hypothetical protein
MNSLLYHSPVSFKAKGSDQMLIYLGSIAMLKDGKGEENKSLL